MLITGVASHVKFTPLEPDDNIFLENLDTAYLYSNTANVIIGIDTSDLFKQIENISVYKNRISSTPRSADSQEELDTLDKRIINVRNLARHIKTLLHRRNRRGLLNFVGSISKTLFGTLDTDDLDLINQNMDKLFNDNNKIKTILANHTSLVRKILNSESLQNLENSYNQLARKVDSQTVFRKTLAKLEYAIEDLHFQIDELLNALILGKQGIISPQILNPDEFLENYAKIVNTAAYSSSITPRNEHFQFILDISDLTVFAFHDKLFFKISVPLVLEQEWKITRVYPIPREQNGIFMAPIVDNPVFLSANLFYMNTDLDYLAKFCKHKSVTICKQTQPIHNGNTNNDCPSEIVNFQRNINHCEISVYKIDYVSFIPLHAENQYLALPSKPIEIDAICKGNHHAHTIVNPSIISANESCDLLFNNEYMRIGESKTEIKYETKLKTIGLSVNDSYVNILDKLRTAPKIINNLSSYRTSIDSLDDEITKLNFNHRMKTLASYGMSALQILGYTSVVLTGLYTLNKFGLLSCLRNVIPGKLCFHLFCCKIKKGASIHNEIHSPQHLPPIQQYNIDQRPPLTLGHVEEGQALIQPQRVRFKKTILKQEPRGLGSIQEGGCVTPNSPSTNRHR